MNGQNAFLKTPIRRPHFITQLHCNVSRQIYCISYQGFCIQLLDGHRALWLVQNEGVFLNFDIFFSFLYLETLER